MLKKQTLNAVRSIEDLLKKAQGSGQLDKEKDPHALAHYLIAGVGSIWQTQILFSNEKLTRQMALLLTASITA